MRPTRGPALGRRSPAKRLPRTIERLRNKRPLTIALLGDSISTGCNASGWAKAAPFQPPYQDLLVLNLEAVYGAPVTLQNLAVGGTDTAWGLANIGQVIQAQPHLVILAFGMNDAAGRPAAGVPGEHPRHDRHGVEVVSRDRVHPRGDHAWQQGLDGSPSRAVSRSTVTPWPNCAGPASRWPT